MEQRSSTIPVLRRVTWIAIPLIAVLELAGRYADRRAIELQHTIKGFLRHELTVDGLRVSAGPGFAVNNGDSGTVLVTESSSVLTRCRHWTCQRFCSSCHPVGTRTASLLIGNVDAALVPECVERNRLRDPRGVDDVSRDLDPVHEGQRGLPRIMQAPGRTVSSAVQRFCGRIPSVPSDHRAHTTRWVRVDRNRFGAQERRTLGTLTALRAGR